MARGRSPEKNAWAKDKRGKGIFGKPRPSNPESPDRTELSPGLYVTATPIGNARDITLRALDILSGCDSIAAEDTRVTAKLLALHGIAKPLSPYNDHNGERERPHLLAKLRAGGRVALVSDAGTPLVSDPGYKLVRAAISENIPVYAIPGPSAVLAALVLSGLPSDRFLFAGFLPPKTGERRAALQSLRNETATLIFFESGQRLAQTLSDMAEIFGDRKAAISREMTKLFEETERGNLPGLASHFAAAPAAKGEITLVVEGATEEKLDRAKAGLLLDMALEFMPVRAATDLLSEALDLPRKELYAMALERKRSHD